MLTKADPSPPPAHPPPPPQEGEGRHRRLLLHPPAGLCHDQRMGHRKGPKLREDQETFRPARFLKLGVTDFKGSNFEFIPFGLGRKSCPGIRGARYVLELVVAHLRRCFNFIVLVDAATFDNVILDGLAGDDIAWVSPNTNSLGSFAKNSPHQELVVRSGGGGSEIQGRQWQRLVVAEVWWLRWGVLGKKRAFYNELITKRYLDKPSIRLQGV